MDSSGDDFFVNAILGVALIAMVAVVWQQPSKSVVGRTLQFAIVLVLYLSWLAAPLAIAFVVTRSFQVPDSFASGVLVVLAASVSLAFLAVQLVIALAYWNSLVHFAHEKVRL